MTAALANLRQSGLNALDRFSKTPTGQSIATYGKNFSTTQVGQSVIAFGRKIQENPDIAKPAFAAIGIVSTLFFACYYGYAAEVAHTVGFTILGAVGQDQVRSLKQTFQKLELQKENPLTQGFACVAALAHCYFAGIKAPLAILGLYIGASAAYSLKLAQQGKGAEAPKPAEGSPKPAEAKAQ